MASLDLAMASLSYRVTCETETYLGQKFLNFLDLFLHKETLLLFALQHFLGLGCLPPKVLLLTEELQALLLCLLDCKLHVLNLFQESVLLRAFDLGHLAIDSKISGHLAEALSVINGVVKLFRRGGGYLGASERPLGRPITWVKVLVRL